jgi:hypothetical protein
VAALREGRAQSASFRMAREAEQQSAPPQLDLNRAPARQESGLKNIHMSFRRRFRWMACAALAALVWSLALVAVVWANGSPVMWIPQSGGLVVPPSVADVKVQRCQLSIDFTSRQAAQVRATYQLVNASDKAVEADLVFISPSKDDLKLSLDDKPVQLNPSDESLPQTWLNPTHLVDPGNGQVYEMDQYYARPRVTNRGWSFHTRLPAQGQSTVAVDYSSTLGVDPSKGYYQTRHLAYVLGPATQWAGPLEVSITAPSRYTLGSSPSISRQGDVEGLIDYRATFEKAPTEVLVVSTQAIPDGVSDFVAENLTLIGLLSPVAPALIVGVVVGIVFSRLKRRWLAFIVAGAFGLALALLAAVVVSVTMLDNETLKPIFDEMLDSMVVGYNAVSLLSSVILAPLIGGAIAAVWAATGSARQPKRRAKK